MDEPGRSLNCVLLAPAPDWVAIDLASGALVRSPIAATPPNPGALSGGPLSPVALVLGPERDEWDPSRPEAILVSDAAQAAPPSRRSVRRLLAQVAKTGEDRGLLGTVGPSLAFADLEGTRPSISVLSPAAGKVRLVAGECLTAHFNLGSRAYAMRVAEGAASWLESGQVPTSTGRKARGGRAARRDARAALGPGVDVSVPVFLVVGLDRPHQGQVRKMVLGLVPA